MPYAELDYCSEAGCKPIRCKEAVSHLRIVASHDSHGISELGDDFREINVWVGERLTKFLMVFRVIARNCPQISVYFPGAVFALFSLCQFHF